LSESVVVLLYILLLRVPPSKPAKGWFQKMHD
jgi:hypothetical protein